MLFQIVLCSTTFGQKAQTVRPITEVLESPEYYYEQATLWESATKEAPGRADAWLNYFTAARSYKLLTGKEPYPLDEIVAAAQQHAPDTYETYFITFWQSNLAEKDYNLVLKAHQLAPERTEILDDLVMYFELNGKTGPLQEVCKKWLDSGELSPGILDWNYNALMSVEDKGILLVQADNATFPAWVLQQAREVRTDVQVLNLYLLVSNEAYRERKLAELQIEKIWERNENASVQEAMESISDHLIRYAKAPVYFNISVGANLRKRYEDNLYLTGLAMKYSDQVVDNMALLRKNYEQSFRIDQLYEPISHDISISVANHINWNYLPALSKLYAHYRMSEEFQKAKRVKVLATRIAERAGKIEDVSALFN